MPPGLPASDLAHLLPEIVLTIGALAMLITDVLAPARRALLTGVALAVLVIPKRPMLLLKISAEIQCGNLKRFLDQQMSVHLVKAYS